MTDTPVQPPLPRAKTYLPRLLMLMPAIAMLSIGLWVWKNPPPGGSVQSIRLMTKPDMAGQARDAYDSIDPATPDFYLVLARRNDEPEVKLPPFDDTPIGNGLTFALPRMMDLESIAQVAVWDHNAMMSDKQLDRIDLDGHTWSAAGQTFRVDLYGQHPQPPDWALPLAAVGGVLAAVVLLKFVWDQAL